MRVDQEIMKELQNWIEKSLKKIEIAKLNRKACIAQKMSDGAINAITEGIERETGRLNGYKDVYDLLSLDS